MSKTKTYKIVGGKHGRYEGGNFVIYHTGQTIELTDQEAHSLRGKIQPFISGGGEKVPLPDDWEDLPAKDKKTLASKLSGNKIANVKDAEKILKAYENG